ncbi:MAG TPA: hypothetical protein VHT75_18935 [Acidimicrobiales bacterium]|nr:hypothetical protein [Acidimicrobiales bacterium]
MTASPPLVDVAPTFAPTVRAYDRARYDFVSAVAEALSVERLDRLGDQHRYDRLVRETDQATEFHSRFYAAFPAIRPLYRRFIDEVVAPVIAEPFCFQSVPTFRVHLPSNVAVGEFHTDGDYNHPVGEINFWLPLTDAHDTNTVWIETSLGRGDCAPAPRLGPGRMLVFDAVRWRHGNVPSETGSTRVSFDFRCIPLRHYRPASDRSVNTKKLMVIGDYFEV